MDKLVIANWKAAPATLEDARELARNLLKIKTDSVNVVICPPMPFLEEISKEISGSGIILGAQDVAPGTERGQTGEETAEMLAGLGVRYVIVGHSERRWKLGEPDEIVKQKLISALAAGLTPIVCLGEKTREGDWEDFLRAQTKSVLASLSESEINKCVLAYEPVWAISTNPGAQADTPESASAAVKIILQEISAHPKILYGGSVNPENAKTFLSSQVFNGVLVGGASLNADDFSKIVSAAKD
ncbi:MAG: triose-phosphate isomerase [Patescibacteria group bacterium]